MVDVMGHFAMALLWALPAWALWDGRVSLLFIGFAVATAMLPDVDLVLSMFLPIQHHGITHTVLFVTLTSVVVGALVEYGLGSWLERQWLAERGYHPSSGALFIFVAGGLLLGGYSHLFADMLSAPDIAAPVEPFWPFFEKPWSVDLIWYNSRLWNAGLLVAGVLLHVLVAATGISYSHPWGFHRTD